MYVSVPLPAEGVFVAAAFAASARVVEEHAVACVRQHACVTDRSLAVAAAAVYEHDRRPVTRRYVPASEVNAVGRGERDLLVRKPQCSLVDRRARLREIVDHEHGRIDNEEDDDHRDRQTQGRGSPRHAAYGDPG